MNDSPSEYSDYLSRIYKDTYKKVEITTDEIREENLKILESFK